jgi:Integrase core domain
MDRPTGRVIRRYERERTGELVHVDIKKRGKIPDGGGWKVLGRQAGKKKNDGHGPSRVGYGFIHSAVDDHSRLAYSEILGNEQKDTAAGFWKRASAWFAEMGITIEEVLTDNGSCYRSKPFAEALGPVKHRRTRPYRPQTNGKVERFNRTMLEE